MGSDSDAPDLTKILEYVLGHVPNVAICADMAERFQRTDHRARLVELIREEFVDVVKLMEIIKASHPGNTGHLKLYADGSGHIGCGPQACCQPENERTRSWGYSLGPRCLRELAKGLPAQTQANDIALVKETLGISRAGLEAFGRLCGDGVNPRKPDTKGT